MKLRCTIMRGGTSKGIVLRESDLPQDAKARDRMILALFGSPDRRQIDGLGGADPLTSKVAIVSDPSRPDADIDYTFGQVSIDAARVDYAGYCGNVLAAVAAYAVNERYVAPTEPRARVRIHITNTGRVVTAEVPVEQDFAREHGDVVIAGVPGSVAPIEIDFAPTVGSVTGRLLPTGRAVDDVHVNGVRPVAVSVVDVANPMIFVAAEAFGLSGAEGPDDLDSRRELIDELERLRIAMARDLGIFGADGGFSENIPLIALVAPPIDYVAYGGESVSAAAMDFSSRELFRNQVHPAYGVGETICTAAAAFVRGTVVQKVSRHAPAAEAKVRIGHPSGVIEVDVHGEAGADRPVFHRLALVRTARRLMDGFAYAADWKSVQRNAMPERSR